VLEWISEAQFRQWSRWIIVGISLVYLGQGALLLLTR
jgi:hypothetical protein